MRDKKRYQKLLGFLALSWLNMIVGAQSAQLVDQLPSEINDHWSICAIYIDGESDCQSSALQNVKPSFERPVSRFIYTKPLIISSELNQSILGLWLNVVDETDEVRLNGYLIGKTGHAPPNYQSGFRHQRLYLLPSYAIKYNQFNQLEIKTFSGINRPGIRYHSVFIDNYLDLLEEQKRGNALYVAIMTILILLTLFQLYYYFMVKGSDEVIYLTVFLLAFILITFTRSPAPLHIGLDLNAVLKIEMFLMSVGFVSFIFFIFRFFELTIKKQTIFGSIAISLVGIVSIVYPNPLHLRIIYEFGYWIICFFALFTLGYAMLMASSQSMKYTRYVNIISFLAWLVICFDALSQSKILFDRHFELFPWLLPFTAALVGIAMVTATTYKYWQFFKTANYDHLTGMLLKPAFFNRLNDKLSHLRDNEQVLLVAVISIGEISHISSSFGQGVGNHILQLISQTIYKYITPIDLVCQFNRQEFCIAVNLTKQAEAENFIRRFHKGLVSNQQPIGEDTELYIGAKIGAVLYNTEQHQSVTQLLQDANYGLERAKNHPSQDVILVSNPTRI